MEEAYTPQFEQALEESIKVHHSVSVYKSYVSKFTFKMQWKKLIVTNGKFEVFREFHLI